MRDCGLTEEQVRADLIREAAVGDGSEPPAGRPRLSPASKRVLQRGSDSLTLQGDQVVDTQHLLLGILEDQNCGASRLVQGHLEPRDLRRRVFTRMQTGGGATVAR